MSDDKTGQKVIISQKSTNQTKYDSELVVFEEIITHHPSDKFPEIFHNLDMLTLKLVK